MSGKLLTGNDRKEALSRAYVAAVAAGAGYVTAHQDFDRDGVDIQIRAGGAMRPTLDIQLKATANLAMEGDDGFRYPLRRRNYDLLRDASMVPRVLVVLDLPADEAMWINVSTDELVLRRCAYWVWLGDKPEAANSETVTVSISRKNLFDVDGLRNLMGKADTGALS